MLETLKKYSKFIDNNLLTDNENDILGNGNIHLVVETMGGQEFADKVITQSLISGKNVVTANKDLLANKLPKYLELCKKHNVNLGIEASVCGGIPIISTIFNSLSGDNITQISGIMNGTTNYILSNMEHNNVSFADILKKAQDLGFAEADPTSDVDGHDIKYKIAILTKLCYGHNVDISKNLASGNKKH